MNLKVYGAFTFSGLHQVIMIYRVAAGNVEIVQTNGIWLGVMDNIESMLTDERLSLKVGDTMLLFTDGITEAWIKGSLRDIRRPDDAMFGIERLKQIFTETGNFSTQEIKNRIQS